MAGTKLCKSCGKAKPRTEYSPHSQTKDGLRPTCKTCRTEAERLRRQTDPAVAQRQRERARLAREQDPDLWQQRRRAYQRTFYLKHRERLRPQLNAMTEAWKRANPDKYRANYLKQSAVRRARKAATSIGPVDLTEVLRRHGPWCHICDQEIEDDSVLEFDHVVPLSRGGAHVEGNIRPSHRTCNRKKYNHFRWIGTPEDKD